MIFYSTIDWKLQIYTRKLAGIFPWWGIIKVDSELCGLTNDNIYDKTEMVLISPWFNCSSNMLQNIYLIWILLRLKKGWSFLILRLDKNCNSLLYWCTCIVMIELLRVSIFSHFNDPILNSVILLNLLVHYFNR